MIMYKSAKSGWYKLINPEKFIIPLDEYMKSYKDGAVNYKSGLELKAIRYCDFNKFVQKFSLEPFAIKYIKPTDSKVHRYFIDLYIEFSSGDKFLVEVKSSAETKSPKVPKKKTPKALANHKRALETYTVNTAKWTAAKEFAEANNINFTFLTEKELG